MPAGEGKALWDLSFTLEARDDAEMPERLIGGATFCRVHTAAMPTLAEDAGRGRPAADGRLVGVVRGARPTVRFGRSVLM